MRKMGIAAPGPKPRTTKPAAGYKIFPYLLREKTLPGPNRSIQALILCDHPSPARWCLDGRMILIVVPMVRKPIQSVSPESGRLYFVCRWDYQISSIKDRLSFSTLGNLDLVPGSFKEGGWQRPSRRYDAKLQSAERRRRSICLVGF